jgi:hypothetical protein
MSDKAAILRKLEQCAEGLEADMKENGWAGKTVTLKFKLDTYEGDSVLRRVSHTTYSRSPAAAVFTRAKSFNRWVTKKEELFDVRSLYLHRRCMLRGLNAFVQTGKELLQPEWPLKLRLIGLRVTKLRDLQVPAEEKSSGIKRVRRHHHHHRLVLTHKLPPSFLCCAYAASSLSRSTHRANDRSSSTMLKLATTIKRFCITTTTTSPSQCLVFMRRKKGKGWGRPA